VPILTTLAENFEVLLVLSQPDEKVGRKQLLTPPPVKIKAQELHLPIYQPAKVNAPEVLEKLAALQPDYLIVAAYGQILKQSLLNLPKRACLNAHASLLPKYRGASPIQTALLNQETETGMTIMLMDAGLDTGAIIKQAKLTISPTDDYFSLESKLSELAAELLLTVLQDSNWQSQSQAEAQATPARIFKKEDGLLDFKGSTAAALDAKIRAFAKWPQCYTYWNAKRLKILSVEVVPGTGVPGQVSWDGQELKIACKNASLLIKKLQLEGKAVQTADVFMRGYPQFQTAEL